MILYKCLTRLNLIKHLTSASSPQRLAPNRRLSSASMVELPLRHDEHNMDYEETSCEMNATNGNEMAACSSAAAGNNNDNKNHQSHNSKNNKLLFHNINTLPIIICDFLQNDILGSTFALGGKKSSPNHNSAQGNEDNNATAHELYEQHRQSFIDAHRRHMAMEMDSNAGEGSA